MPSSACPSSDRWTALISGRCGEEQANELLDHLGVCGACCARLEGLSGEFDALLLSLGSSRGGNAAQEDILVNERENVGLAERLARISRVVSHRELGDTAASDQLAATGAWYIRDYQLLEPLGHGGNGSVFRAMHARLRKQVAVKMLREAHFGSAAARARFRREMLAVGQLDHPNIVRATDAGEDDDVPYLVMEHVEGEDLHRLVQRTGPLDVAHASDIIRQAAEGLHYAHQAGVVHRDIKPSNLMLTPAGCVKILDLGLASLQDMEDGADALTSTGIVMGTPDFLAPEQAGSGHPVDHRADVYSLGCTLYFLLTGRPPFSGQRYTTALQKIQAHLSDSPPPCAGQSGEVPAELAGFIARMLAKSPAERPQTASAVAAELQRFAAPTSEARPTKSGNAWHTSQSVGGVRTPSLLGRIAVLAGVLSIGIALTLGLKVIGSSSRQLDPNATTQETSPHDRSAAGSGMVPRNDNASVNQLSSGPSPRNLVAGHDDAEWDLVFEDTFDEPDWSGEKNHRVWGVRDGSSFQEILAGGKGFGSFNRFHTPLRNLKAEIRVRLSAQASILAVTFRAMTDEMSQTQFLLTGVPGENWTLYRDTYALRDGQKGNRSDRTTLVQVEGEDAPYLRPGEWMSLRLVCWDRHVRIEAEGQPLLEYSEPLLSAQARPAQPALNVGIWSSTDSEPVRLEIDSVRLWTRGQLRVEQR